MNLEIPVIVECSRCGKSLQVKVTRPHAVKMVVKPCPCSETTISDELEEDIRKIAEKYIQNRVVRPIQPMQRVTPIQPPDAGGSYVYAAPGSFDPYGKACSDE